MTSTDTTSTNTTSTDTTNRVEAARAAALTVARAHGLAADEAALLHDGVNVVVHLRPAPVVARVATLTPLLRPAIQRPFGREVALAGVLAEAGAAVVPPSTELPPGPHEHAGLTLSFWRFVEVLPETPTPARAGAALAELEAALADVDPGWSGEPLDTPLDDLAVFADRGVGLGADRAQVAAVAELTGRLRPLLTGDVGFLHGDTHPGNLLATPGGWCWTDLEDTSRGPRGWDVACLRATGRLDGRAAVAALPDPMSDEELAPFFLLRRLHGAAWWFVHAARVPADLADARRGLATAVDEVSAGLAARRRGPG
ncbi:Ser/Thr protein kinase RdoA involved in Cpx stress response, MazF antagonist [Modestobacter sp. DSM 44400]|uniref:phosphotransferase family protein n=1 Tax=Modestobacter sp. DSM 44400 TaxID=1550230 RepID=UPI00089C395E|nr:phosphotransferase [Modestobacter sp. DSM 44400]SDY59053.1 Ser/Thr protein kinase RdoA involved in Cpx stress response, MazF antagonist [Modestobacter sp. DSM 44400]